MDGSDRSPTDPTEWRAAPTPVPPARSSGLASDAAASDETTGGAVPRRNRTAVIVLGVLAAVAVFGFGVSVAVALQAQDRADEWQNRGEAREAVVADLEAQLAAANDEVVAANDQLGAADQQVTDLQTRVDELASEKAGTEDEREAAIVTVGQLEELVRQAGLVADDLDTCATGAVEVVGLVNELGDYDVDEVNTYVTDVQEVCGRALAENDGLQATIASLQVPGAGE